MDRLNCFNPYQSKDRSHEDNLTWAYLVLLRYSSSAFYTFIEYVRGKHELAEGEKPITILDYLESGWEIETQKGNPVICTNYLLSVLISDEQVNRIDASIQSSERNARYDGIITFGDYLTILIENKPRSNNVWYGQLNPSSQNLADDTTIYTNPSFLEWKEIIGNLNHLITLPTIAGNEKIMIEDFLSFVDTNFSFLNPYDSFRQCKGNTDLLYRRIMNLLKSVAIDESIVKYHKGWGYYLETPYKQIHEIGLILLQNDNEWSLQLSFYYGASQRQAISFYSSNPTFDHLRNRGWTLNPNFHVSFMNTNLVWFRSEDSDHYLNFWKNNIDRIAQQKRPMVTEYLNSLIDEGVINMSADVEEKLDKRFFSTEMQTLNMCPEFGFLYSFSSSEAEALDKNEQFKYVLADKIREGLRVVGIDGTDLLKRF